MPQAQRTQLALHSQRSMADDQPVKRHLAASLAAHLLTAKRHLSNFLLLSLNFQLEKWTSEVSRAEFNTLIHLGIDRQHSFHSPTIGDLNNATPRVNVVECILYIFNLRCYL